MIQKYIDYWNKDKDKLEEYIRTHTQEEYEDYKDLVKLVFDIIINPNLQMNRDPAFNTDKILVIDDGNYQGTQVIVLHRNCYQPSVGDYVYTNTYYGSCSACDTLMRIQHYKCEELPNESQVKEYMLLCLHLLEKCHFMEDDSKAVILTEEDISCLDMALYCAEVEDQLDEDTVAKLKENLGIC